MERQYLIKQKTTLLRDIVFAADDGILTTFAVIAGSAGAALNPNVAIALGFSNIFADGFVVSTSLYLGIKSELEVNKQDKSLVRIEGSPFHHGTVTFFSFCLFGLIPLIPFLFDLPSKLITSAVMVAISLFLIGLFKAFYTKKSWLLSGLEMMVIGGVSALFAFAVGRLADIFLV